MRLRTPGSWKHERTTDSATETFWCMHTLPRGAPMMRPIWSPTESGSVHQPSPHARMPRSAHVRAYSRILSSTAAGIAPSEWLIRYVVCSRIGKRSRYDVSSTSVELAFCGPHVTRRGPEETACLLLLEDVRRPAGHAGAPEHRRRERRRDLCDVED